MNKATRENRLNVIGLALAWTGFICWFILASHLPRQTLVLLLTAVVSLAMQQYIAGVYHEAAHGNFIQGNKRLNEFLANWFGAYTFLISVNAYRLIHFKHHNNKIFLVREDEETRAVEASRPDLLKGLIRDLTAISALELFLLKTSAEKKKTLMDRLPILFHFMALWGLLSFFGSPWFTAVFFLTLGTIYPLSARIRAWGTHGDLYAAEGMRASPVARNLMSPVFERAFIGNRMMMYHYEHHLEPHLTFRECERKAIERFRRSMGPIQSPDATEDGLPVYNVHAPSYFFFVREFLRGGYSSSASPRSRFN
jgi:fatty acid desaturase